MSTFAGYCGYCGKPVMHKTLFGTLHVCVTEVEQHLIDRRRQEAVLLQTRQQQLVIPDPRLRIQELLKAPIKADK